MLHWPSPPRICAILAALFRAIAQSAERLAEETEFTFLADPARKILSAGFDVRGQRAA